MLLNEQEASEALSETVKKASTRFNVTTRLLRWWALLTGLLGQAAAVALLLFIVHQLFVWVDRDPEKAFERAALFLEIVEISWDVFGTLVNSAVDILNAAVIPIWNAGTYYIVEPVVILVLEVFSLVFAQKRYEGLIDEAGFPYMGLDCDSSPAAQQWCGRYTAYEKLMVEDKSGFYNGSNFYVGISAARRLSELSGGTEFVAPEFSTDEISDSLVELSTVGITAGAPLADVGGAILDDVFTTAASAIFDAVFFLIKNLLEVFKMLVKDGLLTFLVGVGVDFAVIYAVYYALPLFFAAIDFIVCVIDWFFPSGWAEQLKCAEANCFKGPSAMTDLLIFSSVPVVTAAFGNILEATLNSNTGRKFVGGSFAYDAGAGIADFLQSFYPTAALQDCTACFNCKWPELRLLWWLTASVVSIVSSTNFETFYGNVTQNCMDGGAFYVAACGPRGAGAEVLPYSEWVDKYYAGWFEFDPVIGERYAALLYERAEEMGESAEGYDGGFLLAAVDAWRQRYNESAHPGLPPAQEAAPLVFQMCRIMRASDAGQQRDIGPGFINYTERSTSYISGAFLYDTCKRARHETYNAVGRGIHDFGFELASCLQSPVTLKKQFERCIGRCSGVDTNELVHDFHTTVAKAELSIDILGEEGVAAAEANCTPRTATVLIDLFEGGDSFKTFAARERVRSGMTALDATWCQDNPLSCGAIQRVLERSPGLRFVNGAFRHVFSTTAPSPPPTPFPPPGLNYGPSPPVPQPPPVSPPPCAPRTRTNALDLA